MSHILIKTEGTDTLVAYNKAIEAIKRLNSGEDFAKIADELSDDQSVARNHGYLGWFTALQLVWPFEKAMYDQPLNQICTPIKSDYGYHIIKRLDTRENEEDFNTCKEVIKAVKTQVDYTAKLDEWVNAQEKKEIKKYIDALEVEPYQPPQQEMPAEGEAAPVEGEAAPVEGEEVPVEGEAVPVEGEEAAAEVEEAPAEAETAE